MSTKTEIATTITKSIVGVSTAFTVANVLKNNVHPTNSLQKTELWIGSTVVGLVAAEHAERYIHHLINIIVAKTDERSN